MIVYIQEMINLILGDMSAYPWYSALNDILIFASSLIIIYMTYKLWLFIFNLLGGLFKWQ